MTPSGQRSLTDDGQLSTTIAPGDPDDAPKTSACKATWASKLIQRTFEVEGSKRSSIEITAAAVGPELKFATAEITKAGSASDGPAAAFSTEQQTA